MSKRNAETTHLELIRAAIRVVSTKGALALTLDAVALEAGVSKGGLLYHFPTKEALIEALLRQLLADYEQQVHEFYEQETVSDGRWLRAYIRATFADEEFLPMELLVMLLSAITDYPNLLRLVQEDHQQWEQRLISDGLPVARVRVIRMAADSYWQERLIGVGANNAEERHDLINELLKWLEVDK